MAMRVDIPEYCQTWSWLLVESRQDIPGLCFQMLFLWNQCQHESTRVEDVRCYFGKTPGIPTCLRLVNEHWQSFLFVFLLKKKRTLLLGQHPGQFQLRVISCPIAKKFSWAIWLFVLSPDVRRINQFPRRKPKVSFSLTPYRLREWPCDKLYIEPENSKDKIAPANWVQHCSLQPNLRFVQDLFKMDEEIKRTSILQYKLSYISEVSQSLAWVLGAFGFLHCFQKDHKPTVRAPSPTPTNDHPT